MGKTGVTAEKLVSSPVFPRLAEAIRATLLLRERALACHAGCDLSRRNGTELFTQRHHLLPLTNAWQTLSESDIVKHILKFEKRHCRKNKPAWK